MFEKVDHVGIAVTDLDQAISFYERVFGVRFTYRHTVEEQGVEEAMGRVGESWIQLLRPLSDDTPVGKFIAQRGEGVHHIGYGVADVEQAIKECLGHDVKMIDHAPRRGSRGASIAFIHPKSVGGVLTELVQEAGD